MTNQSPDITLEVVQAEVNAIIRGENPQTRTSYITLHELGHWGLLQQNDPHGGEKPPNLDATTTEKVPPPPTMATRLSVGAKVGGLFAVSAVSFACGFVTGIIPGLLLGLPDWHQPAALAFGIVFAAGYVGQRASKYQDVAPVTFFVAIGAGLGIGLSVFLFGSLTS